MVVNIPTEVIPIWYIEKWLMENVQKDSPAECCIKNMMNDWKTEEVIQKEKHIVYRS